PAPAYRHRLGPRYVAEQDRRTYAPGAVALHPSVAGEEEPVQLFTEVLHHVGSLGLAMHENVQASFLLETHDRADLAGEERLVLCRVDLSCLESKASAAHVVGLRERADGGGREQGE